MKKFASRGRAFLKKHPEIIKRRNKAIRKAYKSRKLRKKISEAMKREWKNPAYAKLIDKKVTEWWENHPNIRKKRSDEIKRFFQNNQDKFESKFLNGKVNSSKLKYKTRQGFKVRSKCEKQIADFLHKNKIQCKYEAEALNLEGNIFVPDFYLPDYEIYMEYYGGFPGSWKKKVLKNKLYAKYSVDCIFITPAELKDLDNSLLGELRRWFGKGFL